MMFLLRISKELRPKRRDLAGMVKRHFEANYEQPETILDDMESSSDCHLTPRPSTPAVDDCCNVRCGCFNCNCNPCCSGCCCCVILAIMFSFFAAAAAVVWYVHGYLPSNNKGLSEAGPIVIGLLRFIAACCVVCGVYISIRQRRNELTYSILPSINDARSMSNQAAYGSYAASDSTRTTCSGRMQRK